MGRAKSLSEFEKGQIAAYKKQNHSLRQIGRLINRSKSVFGNYLRLGSKYGIKKSKGRKNKLDLRKRRTIIRTISNKTMSLNQIKSEFKLNVSKSTICRLIKQAPFITHSKKKTKPRLTKSIWKID